MVKYVERLTSSLNKIVICERGRSEFAGEFKLYSFMHIQHTNHTHTYMLTNAIIRISAGPGCQICKL